MTTTAQERQLEALKAEIARLDNEFEAQLNNLGLTVEELEEEPLPDDEYMKKILTLAQEATTQAGHERARQYLAEATKSARIPGAGRKGAIRL